MREGLESFAPTESDVIASTGLYANVTNLIAILEKTRDDLARKYGEVWEDETLTQITKGSLLTEHKTLPHGRATAPSGLL